MWYLCGATGYTYLSVTCNFKTVDIALDNLNCSLSAEILSTSKFDDRKLTVL